MTIIIILLNLFFISGFIYLAVNKKSDKFYIIISFLTLIALDLSFLSIYLSFSIPLFFLIMLPFAPSNKNHNKFIPIKHEEIEYYNDFKEFISNYLELIETKYPFFSTAIYENKGSYHKSLKVYPFDKFKHAAYTIENSSSIFEALKHTVDDKFTISDNNKIISDIIENNHDEKLNSLIYMYEGYLIFIFYKESIDEKLIKSLNSFLALFKGLRKQLALKEYNEKLLLLSKNLNKALSLNDTLENFISAIKGYVGFETVIFTIYENEAHTLKRVISINPLIEELEGTILNDTNSLIDLSFKTSQSLPSSFRYDYTKNYLLDTELFNDCKSIIVYPVKEQGKTIGTLTLLSKEEHLYEKSIVNNLELMFNIFEVSYFNAKIFRRMEEMATIDGLTGLVNHRTFQEKLDEYLQRAKRYNKTVAVVLTDIDHFKLVNDNYGHPMGDEVLRQISSVLKKSVRNVDLVARYGGEEFVIILEDSNEENTTILTNRIREDIKAINFTSKGTDFNVTISMGFSLYGKSSTEKKELIEFADQALYYSKDNGRDRVTFIDNIKK